jgi:tubulin epsilon
LFNEPLSSFFYNCDPKTGQEIPIGGGSAKIRGLKARAVLIDSEEGVLSHVLRSKLGELFSGGHFIKDNSGAGNNWAVGYNEYGPKHHEALLDEFHAAAEKCDSLQSFFMMHSLGGGTGSGLGSYVLEMLADHFPSVYRFTTSVFPQEDDDVVTSPYNSILALDKLVEHAHCVMPFDNQP